MGQIGPNPYVLKLAPISPIISSDVQIGGVSQINNQSLLSLMHYGKAVNMLVLLSPKDKFATKVELVIFVYTMQQWKFELVSKAWYESLH
ncbi:MAG: hypothetical protein EZS28_020160 [Streblomastix strix]|uniref:Uncharacterized protein n=1 Tax=Streblomastix strix TaxID=222440 RepID=A0A5J4VNZ9_9EUKA|nr:MAG: hypothetical protein EZS28_020160 [Streblomastix strix]